MVPKLDYIQYAPYFNRYLNLVEYSDLHEELSSTTEIMLETINSVDASRLNYRYAGGKWSVAEVLGHIIETEQIFAYRALTIAREDGFVELPGFEQDEYVSSADYSALSKQDLLDYFNGVRQSCLALIKTIPKERFRKEGRASGNAISPEILFFVSSGHCRHHVNVLRELYS